VDYTIGTSGAPRKPLIDYSSLRGRIVHAITRASSITGAERIFADGFSVECLTMTTEIHDLGDRHIGPRPRFGERQLTAPRSPRQNAYIERFIGSVRRECLDHVIVLSAAGLRRVLNAYVEYFYTASRTHLALEKDTPVSRLISPPTPDLSWRFRRSAASTATNVAPRKPRRTVVIRRWRTVDRPGPVRRFEPPYRPGSLNLRRRHERLCRKRSLNNNGDEASRPHHAAAGLFSTHRRARRCSASAA
jgi:hypothetical protein